MTRYERYLKAHGRLVRPGAHFGRLTVRRIIQPTQYVRAVVKCRCGKVKTVLLKNLINGRTKSCGCRRSDMLKSRHRKERRNRKVSYTE